MAAVAAAATASAYQMRQRNAQKLSEITPTYDKNGSESLKRELLLRHIDELLHKLDLNKNGHLTRLEVQSLLVPLNGGRKVSPEAAQWILDHTDLTKSTLIIRLQLARAIADYHTYETWSCEHDPAHFGDRLPPPTKNEACCVCM
eukprot:gnl/TRDRNA2_/TRDRNA2_81564_c0_seq1.p1 gnl/TRDRNA2_/TRDRNA2_81564_c0~~gnl/TRDRNA2_/TRDRNA2_81564_c0_seq1.p1  ORF type:complete len:145 (-),score=18.59 gnl/TRDRNA2_/TRDRNA2_81564_c0_seq1:326-760(-)